MEGGLKRETSGGMDGVLSDIDRAGGGKGRGEALKGILVADINRIGLRFIPS